MKNIFILTFLISLTYSIHAQNSHTSDNFGRQYDRNTIYLKKSGFEKDGKTIRYGMFKKNLKTELMASPMAYAEYKRSRTNNWVVVGCTIASAALTFSGAQRVFVKKELSYSGLGFNLLSIPFIIKSNNQLNHAIWLYNRETFGQNK